MLRITIETDPEDYYVRLGADGDRSVKLRHCYCRVFSPDGSVVWQQRVLTRDPPGEFNLTVPTRTEVRERFLRYGQQVVQAIVSDSGE